MNAPRTVLRIAGDSPRKRGEDRGRQAREGIRCAWGVYEELFATVAAANGRDPDPAHVSRLALRTVEATRAWAPDLVEEMEGVAEGAGVPFTTIAALNARTEILAEAGAPRAGECSTLVDTAAGPALGGQCWDWHEELADAWHPQTVGGDLRAFAGITEHGILAKIGVNDAGVGVLFNILGHTDDAATGVPVHLVARQVLGTAGSFAEAVGILTGAPVSASTVITVVTADRAASVELAPGGSAVVAPDERGRLVRTNHFLDPALAAGELRGRREPETYDRHRLLTARVGARSAAAGPFDPEALAGLLAAHQEDGAEVCCHAPADGRLGSRWATLATVAVDPAARSLAVHDGGPCSATPSTWTRLTPPSTRARLTPPSTRTRLAPPS
ncbi:C45 family autoproteolytic acyltransferase/hydolase [Streptomyces sp. NPDC056144]|uniref:C45 family autoproteolytic acyltransferase/hydolase n=1 Tax=unclassified Streptomyces TaxID=2593676 RepID=UPI0035DCFAFE